MKLKTIIFLIMMVSQSLLARDIGGGGSMLNSEQDIFGLTDESQNSLNQLSPDEASSAWLNNLSPEERDAILSNLFKMHLLNKNK